ncbi:MAG TPA: PAC2 family protein [Nitrosopumilaceae archaeon]
MLVNKIQDFNLKDIVLISSLPDMGKVGGLVTQHITKKLETKIAAQMILADKPWVNLKDGVIELPHDEYTLSVDEKNSIVIFTGENQPQEPGTVFEIADKVLDIVSQMGNIRMVISAGGYLPSEGSKATKVYGVATDSQSINFLKSLDVKLLSPEVKSITWFNGLILGIAKSRKINAVGLFGEILDAESPQYKTASNIINVIEKIIQIKIDTKELDEKIEERPAEIKKEGPGIG